MSAPYRPPSRLRICSCGACRGFTLPFDDVTGTRHRDDPHTYARAEDIAPIVERVVAEHAELFARLQAGDERAAAAADRAEWSRALAAARAEGVREGRAAALEEAEQVVRDLGDTRRTIREQNAVYLAADRIKALRERT